MPGTQTHTHTYPTPVANRRKRVMGDTVREAVVESEHRGITYSLYPE